MKNNDLHESRSLYPPNDALNLIDLVIILVKRKMLIILTTIFFLVLGIAAASITTKKYTYSTSLEIGSQLISGSIVTFESPQTLLAKLQYNFIPQVLNEQTLINNNAPRKYKIKTSIPKMSNLIIISVKGTEEDADTIKTLLHNTTQKVVLDHNHIYKSIKSDLSLQLEENIKTLSKLSSNADNRDERNSLRNRVAVQSSLLTNLRNTREISPPIKSVESSSINIKLIIIAMTITGLLTAVFIALFAEFITKVQEKIKLLR